MFLTIALCSPLTIHKSFCLHWSEEMNKAQTPSTSYPFTFTPPISPFFLPVSGHKVPFSLVLFLLPSHILHVQDLIPLPLFLLSLEYATSSLMVVPSGKCKALPSLIQRLSLIVPLPFHSQPSSWKDQSNWFTPFHEQLNLRYWGSASPTPQKSLCINNTCQALVQLGKH